MTSNKIPIDASILPCGMYCGVTYTVPGSVDVATIHREAREAGWSALELEDGTCVLVCADCAREASKPSGLT